MEDFSRANGNRIAGRPVSPAGGGRFELHGAGGGSLGSWPRSEAPDAEEALASLRAEGEAWSAAAPARRAEVVLEAARLLERDGPCLELLALRLGMGADELAPRRSGIERRLARHLAGGLLDEGPGAREGGLAVLLPGWTELVRGTALCVLHALARGRPALVLSDRRVPFLADRVAEAAEEAGLPAGALAVLHGAGAAVREVALHARDTAEVAASGAARVLDHVEDLAGGRAARGELTLDVDRGATRTAHVERDDDPVAAAAHVVEEAFGRRRTLSGQLPGRLTRVECAPRALSAFTEALLAAIPGCGGVADPVGLVDQEAEEAVVAARRLGLDEGATLIEGGDPPPDPPSPPTSPGGTGPGGRWLRPLVFTNVESSMEIASAEVPGPLVRLLRA